MRIIVVGGGLAGRWLTRELHARGHEVVVVADAEEPGSNAAIALLRSTYLKPDERPLLAPALELWRVVGQEILSGARATRKGAAKDRHEDDWYAVHPQLPPWPDVELHTGQARPLSSTMVWDGRREVEGDAVVWCDAGGAGHVTYGCTWVHADPAALDEPLRVHQWAPYRVIAAARFADHARMGSSSAGSLNKALEQADRILQEALDAGLIASSEGWHRVDGRRLQREKSLTVDEFGWRWSGFHKNGYALVPGTVQAVADVVTGYL